MTNKLAIYHRCRKCKRSQKNVVNQKEKLHDDVETVTEFSYICDKVYSESGRAVAVTSRTGLGRVRSCECKDLHCGKSSSENQRNSMQMPFEISIA